MNITHNQHKKNKKVYTGILLVCLAVLSVLLACKEATTNTPEENGIVIDPAVNSVTLNLNPATLSSIDKGATAKMTATVDAVGGADTTVDFFETDENGDALATDDQNLIVKFAPDPDTTKPNTIILTAVAPGEAWIVASSKKYPSKKSTPTKITVNGVGTMSIDGGDFSLGIQDTKTLTVIVPVFGTTKNKNVKWLSDDVDVATVLAGTAQGTGVVSAVGEGDAIITVTSDADPDQKTTVTVTVTTDPAVSRVILELDPNTPSPIDKGAQATMIATVEVVNGAEETVDFVETDDKGKTLDQAMQNQIVTRAAHATDTSKIVLTAQAPGKAWIVAISRVTPEKKSAPILITVNGVRSVHIKEANFTLTTVGEKKILTTDVVAFGTTSDTLRWSSNIGTTATVLAGTVQGTGEVTAVANGVTTITATSNADPDQKATVEVTVSIPTVNSVNLALDPNTPSPIDKGAKATMIATVEVVNGAEKTVDFVETDEKGVALGTADQNLIVTLNPDADKKTLELTANAPGEAWIVAISRVNPEKKSAPTLITVNGVASISISGDSNLVVGGLAQTLTAEVLAFGTAKNQGVAWASDNTTIATVTAGTEPNTAIVSPVGEGDATITATADGKTARVKVTVAPQPPLLYHEVVFGVATTKDPILPGITATGYALAATGTATTSAELPTIDDATGTITVTPTTSAGTYKITATVGTENVEATFYVTTAPANRTELNNVIKTGIDNFGLIADFNYIKTSAITNMEGVFSSIYRNNDGSSGSDIKKYMKYFNGDISKWDVSSVTTMKAMFRKAFDFNGDISKWKVYKVTDMEDMFNNADMFNQDLNNWNVSAVTTMESMFDNANIFNQDLSGWNVGAVSNMSSMFGGAGKFNQDLSGWDVSAVRSMYTMFYYAKAFKKNNLEAWAGKLNTAANDGAGVTKTFMFEGSGLEVANNLPTWYAHVKSVALALDPPTSSSIDVGSSTTMKATVAAFGGLADTVTFVETNSTGGKMADVDKNKVVKFVAHATQANTIVLTGEGLGEAWIVATSTVDPSKKSAPTLITVNGIASIRIVPSDFSLAIGFTQQLGITEEEAYGTAKDQGATWISDKPRIVSVSKTGGLVTANKKGQATITATSNADGTLQATVTVTVLVWKDYTVSTEFNNNTYTTIPIFNPTKDEMDNIVNIFINDADFDANTPLELSLTIDKPTGTTISPDPSAVYNFSDTTAEIFTATDGTETFKFRVNVFRKPIIITTQPAANTDTDYDASGISAASIRKFIQTDYYYVPSMIGDTISDLPAPAFALFPAGESPSTENILNSPVRVLRNFSTADGTTLFLAAVDDGKADDDWGNTPLNLDADLRAGLTPDTPYHLHWAIQADNGSFSGTFGEVKTTALPTTEPTTGNFAIKYYGIGGASLHPAMGTYTKLVTLISTTGDFDPLRISFKGTNNRILVTNSTPINYDIHYSDSDLGSFNGKTYTVANLIAKDSLQVLQSYTIYGFVTSHFVTSYKIALTIE